MASNDSLEVITKLILIPELDILSATYTVHAVTPFYCFRTAIKNQSLTKKIQTKQKIY